VTALLTVKIELAKYEGPDAAPREWPKQCGRNPARFYRRYTDSPATLLPRLAV
jgi:hypothetical protein